MRAPQRRDSPSARHSRRVRGRRRAAARSRSPGRRAARSPGPARNGGTAGSRAGGTAPPRRRTLMSPDARPARTYRGHGGLGRHLRPGQGRARALSPLRVPRGPVRDRVARAGGPGGRTAAGARPARAGSPARRSGLLLALGYALQTAGLERTTVSSAGFITGLYVVFTPLLALLLFRTRVGGPVWIGVALAVVGLAMLSGVGAGDPLGDLLVLLGSAAYSVQIVLMERYAPRYDAIAFTQVEMVAAFAGFAIVAVALGQVEMPHGWTVWGALLVTGIFASALAFLVQTWAQRQDERDPDRACVRDGAGLRRDLRFLARRRPAGRGRLGRMCGDHGRDRRRRAGGWKDAAEARCSRLIASSPLIHAEDTNTNVRATPHEVGRRETRVGSTHEFRPLVSRSEQVAR